MNRLLITLLMVGMGFTAFANTVPATTSSEGVTHTEAFSPQALDMGIQQFLELTPATYKEMTGQKLGIKNTLKLKAAQKVLKKKMRKDDADISSGVYVLLAILGLGWLAMGLLSDWSGNDWIINLVLTILCWLPGLIHALVKKSDYY